MSAHNGLPSYDAWKTSGPPELPEPPVAPSPAAQLRETLIERLNEIGNGLAYLRGAHIGMEPERIERGLKALELRLHGCVLHAQTILEQQQERDEADGWNGEGYDK